MFFIYLFQRKKKERTIFFSWSYITIITHQCQYIRNCPFTFYYYYYYYTLVLLFKKIYPLKLSPFCLMYSNSFSSLSFFLAVLFYNKEFIYYYRICLKLILSPEYIFRCNWYNFSGTKLDQMTLVSTTLPLAFLILETSMELD